MTDSIWLFLIQSPLWVIRVNANDARFVAKKPQGLNFVEAAAMPLKYITAYEALVERMEIKKGEQVARLISNGAGGLSSHLFLLRKTLDVPFGFL
jgi:NADPH:quinone reductase-like Zn-dependent oxidoreductase